MSRRSTRIVATVSPMTVRRICGLERGEEPGNSDVARAMALLSEAGVDVFRLNMSFRDDAFLTRVFSWLDENAETAARSVAVLGDLQGPKLRFGEFLASDGRRRNGDGDGEADVEVVRGQEFLLYYRPDKGAGVGLRTPGDAGRGTVLLNDDFYEEFGQCVRDGLKDGPVEIGIADGNTLLKVTDRASVHKTHVICTVEVGGSVGSRKGVMPKRVSIDVPTVLTDKDRDDLRFLLRRGGRHLSFVAMSFVKSPSDVLRLRAEIEDYKVHRAAVRGRIRELGAGGAHSSILRHTLLPNIVAKIETREAVESDALDMILDLSDAVMVARGDLALQMDPDRVPGEQKEIIRRCRLRGKPVITATQMLHSMQEHPRPTRSEVNDVFNAALDGTDATMLSGETASGRYPLESVRTMAGVLRSAEEYWHSSRGSIVEEWATVSRSLEGVVERASERLPRAQTEICASLRGPSNKGLRELANRLYDEKRDKTLRQTTTDMVCMSAWAMISSPEVVGIVAVTTSGRTARMLARFRPDVPIFAITHDDENRRQLLLSSGILPVDIDLRAATGDGIYDAALRRLLEVGWLERASARGPSRELVLFVSGSPLGDPGSTNQLRLVSLADGGFRIAV
ncbi:MAG: pyruvate kinase [Candidatus Eisenbacteria bacterium]